MKNETLNTIGGMIGALIAGCIMTGIVGFILVYVLPALYPEGGY